MKRIAFLLILLALMISSGFAADSKFITFITHVSGRPAYTIFAEEQKLVTSAPNQVWIYSMFNQWRPQIETSYYSVFIIEDYELMAGRYLYICSREPTNTVFEVDSLNVFGKIYFPYTITGDKITREGANMFVADQNRGIDIIDIGSGGGREIKSVFSEKWGVRDFVAQYPYLYALNDFGLVTVDITDLQFPVSIGRNYQINDAKIIRKHGDIIWIGAGKSLYALNVRDLSNPSHINQYRFAYDITDLEIKDGRIYVALGYGGVKILDITNPLKMQEVNQITFQGQALDLAMENDFIYIAIGRDGWLIYEYR